MVAHQLTAADLAHDGRHVVVSTGTASGKSLAYQLPILSAQAADRAGQSAVSVADQGARTRSTSTAQALTDAVARLRRRAQLYDGDSQGRCGDSPASDPWIFSNPDMIHLSLLRNHARWAVFLRNLRFIVVDECHYRGVFGSNVAMVLRRLLRLCTRYSPAPTVILASATTASPAATASELIGRSVFEVTEDGSPQGARTVALWEPALRPDLVGENGARCGVLPAPKRPGDGRPAPRAPAR